MPLDRGRGSGWLHRTPPLSASPPLLAVTAAGPGQWTPGLAQVGHLRPPGQVILLSSLTGSLLQWKEVLRSSEKSALPTHSAAGGLAMHYGFSSIPSDSH